MSDAIERPSTPSSDPDPDAWASACAEDLAAEQARRRAAYGTPPGSAAEEFKRLIDSFADKVTGLGGPFGGMAAGAAGLAAKGAARQFIEQAKSAIEPVIDRNPELFDHLAAAGAELAAAYRSAVSNDEARWTKEQAADIERIDLSEDKSPDDED
ncbi:DUF5304 family protein [Streptomyces boninensis]|uniref:DUF5304 family protein n=1 Tax=Streptomyces boninensis TaxID=2039455 RepID=UPI003B21638E